MKVTVNEDTPKSDRNFPGLYSGTGANPPIALIMYDKIKDMYVYVFFTDRPTCYTETRFAPTDAWQPWQGKVTIDG